MQLSAEDLQAICDLNPALGDKIIKSLTAQAEEGQDPSYVRALFGPQRKFFSSKAKKLSALCSRRAGKTVAVATWLLQGADDCPNGLSVYISRSRANSRLILWATLQDINRRHDLGLRFKNEDNQLMVFTRNNHKIWLCGSSTAPEINKFRGLKLRRAAIDEASSFGEYIRELVDDVLEPALLDLDGELCVISTPGTRIHGWFWEITTGLGTGAMAAKKWETHTWVTQQNPYIQLDKLNPEERKLELLRAEEPDYINSRVDDWLKKKREANGWSKTHPTYVREWLGQWVQDEGALVFPIDPVRNHYYTLPDAPKWMYCIGMDIGYEDDTAFVVSAQQRGSPDIYIVHAEAHSHLIPSAAAAYLQRLKKRFGAYRIIVDSGGIGVAYVEEFRQRFGIHVEAADKRNRRDWIEIVRGEILSGTVKIHPHNASPLLEELSCLVWDEKHEDSDPRFSDHCFSAMLYLVRMVGVHYRPEKNAEPLTYDQQTQAVSTKARTDAMKEVQRRLKKKMRKGQALLDIAAGR